jgi:hypothetical protein
LKSGLPSSIDSSEFFAAVRLGAAGRDKGIIVFLSVGRYNGEREILRGPARNAKEKQEAESTHEQAFR